MDITINELEQLMPDSYRLLDMRDIKGDQQHS